ncbi:YciI family protein [Pseudonocardia nigra]|uniref:YciI family protein n=1 Tax=Pseudonocardia nigra TaxID=1921578 RepID=UPI001C5D3261|nr:YciI family protein [Pseudonocardia nigra]
MKYLILIYGNPVSRQTWAELSDAERSEGLRVYAALDADLAASGELVVSEALADPAQTTRVSVREGRPLTTDGPFAEVKEQLAGFYLVECESSERAVEIAARVPEAEFGLVEVRPVLDLGAMDAWPE